MQKGKFICFEGMDFSGKSTILKRTAEILELWGIDYIITREPGGGALGEAVRNILINGTDLSIREEALLFQAARSHHCRTIIQPALDAGKWVLSDRYIGSSYVYQHEAMDVLKPTTKALNLIEPDGFIYTSCPLDEILKRKASRDKSDITAMDERFTASYETNLKLWNKLVEKVGESCLTLDTTLNTETNNQLIRSWLTSKII